jgi:HlyD family secretion protein
MDTQSAKQNTNQNAQNPQSKNPQSQNSQFKKPIIVSMIGAVVIIAGSVFWYIGSISVPPLVFASVTTGTVTQELESTGMVKAAQNVDLSFQRAGRIISVNAQVGDEVTQGQTLAVLDSSDVQAQLAQAEANVLAQQANLANLQQGARPEQIQIQETAVSAAQTTLQQDQKTLVSQINNAYIAADDAVHTQADQFFNNPHTSNPTLNLQLNDSSLTYTLQSARLSLESIFTSWNTSIVASGAGNAGGNATSTAASTASATSLVSLADQSETNLNAVVSFLDQLAQAINGLTPNANLSQTMIAGYKASIAGARTEATGSLDALVGSEASYKAGQSALTEAQNELTLDQAGTGTSNNIQAQEAMVTQAQAAVQNLNVELGQDIITAPFSGEITVQNAKIGQIASPGMTVMTLNSGAQFQIESYVPETNVSQIAVGDQASVTLDAYGDSVNFPAQVILIDPAETIIGNIPSSKVTLQFSQNDPRIEAGMTANVSINVSPLSTVSKLAVPTQSIIETGNEDYVLVENKNEKRLTLQPIEIGTQGDNSLTQVLSGLTAGEQIVDFGK